jgi:hypothetical protein
MLRLVSKRKQFIGGYGIFRKDPKEIDSEQEIAQNFKRIKKFYDDHMSKLGDGSTTSAERIELLNAFKIISRYEQETKIRSRLNRVLFLWYIVGIVAILKYIDGVCYQLSKEYQRKKSSSSSINVRLG